MQRTIETSMVHEQPSAWMAAQVEFCAGDIAPEHVAGDNPICGICAERIVELAIRGEYKLLHATLATIVKES